MLPGGARRRLNFSDVTPMRVYVPVQHILQQREDFLKTIRWVLAAALVIAALTGCSLFQATLTIYNTSSHTVSEVYISPSDELYWGDDWLAATIPPGGDYEFTGIRADTYDIMVVSTEDGGWVRSAMEMKSGQNYAWNLYDVDYIAP